MSTNIIVTLDTRSIRKDGTSPLIMRLGHKRRTLPIPLGIYIRSKDWDSKKRVVKSSHNDTESVMRLNNRIQKSRSSALDVILKLQDSGRIDSLSVHEVRQQITGLSAGISFYQYGMKQVGLLNQKKKYGTARAYEGLLKVLQAYINERELTSKSVLFYSMFITRIKELKKTTRLEDFRYIVDLLDEQCKKDIPSSDIAVLQSLKKKFELALRTNSIDLFSKEVDKIINERQILFQEITRPFLLKFENHNLSKGNSQNSISVYLRTIRAIYNKAISDGLVDKDLNPFENFKVKEVGTKKRALLPDIFKRIVEIKLSEDDMLFDTRNYFLASYMLYGMNFVDLAQLKVSNIIDGRISYQRSKTSRHFDISILPPLKEILTHYLKLPTYNGYVFPIIDFPDDGPTFEKKILAARKRYNARLKLLGERCDIQENLTSYVSRHSFATKLQLNRADIMAIKTMLGHKSVTTTQIYLAGLPTYIIDDYNKDILQF